MTIAVAEELRDVCGDILARLNELEQRSWHPDAGMEDDEYLLVTLEQIGIESEVLRAVSRQDYDVLSAASLPNAEVLFYAFIVGPAARRIAFLRKYNPRRGLRRRLIAVFTETLSKIDDPLFTFDNSIDVIIDPARGAAILGLGAFEMLFRSSPEMLARTPGYVAEMASALPIDTDSMEMLAAVANSNSSIRRRLQSIVARGHLSSVSIGQVRSELERYGLEVDRYIVDGKLRFDRADARDIMKLLNEDLFRGGLSDQAFQVDRKSPR